jgi:lipopolysaccharide transport system permease protein
MNTESELIIEAGRTERHYLMDIWRYRQLLYFLAWRDILVRYKQTTVGVAWSVIKPFLTMVIFTLIFGRIAKLPSEGVEYPLMVFSALLPWQFFSSAVSGIGASLVGNSNLLTKVYFPRMIVPISALMVNLVDIMISFVVLAGIMFFYKAVPDERILTIPAFILIVFVASFGAGLWIASLNVKYRDFTYIVPFFLQVGLYVSPVGFSSSIVPENWRFVYSLNPMVGVIDGFRWALATSTSPLYWPSVLMSAVVALAFLISGLIVFRNTERTFADII